MVSSQPSNPAGTPNGFLTPTSNWGDFNIDSFVIREWLSKMQTAMPVRIMASTGNGAVGPFGFVDVLPLVNQIDGQGNSTPHETIYNIPYFRIQGGSNAIIIDPAIGDIGICIFASRDISKVKSTQNQANPGTLRQYSFSDGMYIGGILNGTPMQYIEFSAAGIKLVSPVAVIIDTPITTVTGILNVENVNNVGTGSSLNGGFVVTNGDIVADTISLKSHVHDGVQSGSDDTGEPVP